MCVVPGVAPPGRVLQINNADIGTLETAIMERLFYCKVDGQFLEPPIPRTRTVFAQLSPFIRKLNRHIVRHSTPVSPDELVQMYKGRRRKIMEAAAERLSRYGISRELAVSTTFVKCEKVKGEGAPRGIQPRNPVYNVALGVYIKPIEHEIYSSIQDVFESETPIVMKGLNVDEIGNILESKWNEFADPVGIGLDAVKFDMHVSAAMLKWEHHVYQKAYPNDDGSLRKLLTWQVHNRGRGFCYDGKLKFKISGRRFSGDMNTALGNCLIMCSIIYTLGEELDIRLQLLNNGDDCVIIMEKCNVDKFQEAVVDWFLNLGFRLTREKPVYSIEDIEFCQMKPVRIGDSYRMVRLFNKSREKDSISILNITNPKTYAKWMGAVGEGGLALNSGIPVLQSFYQAYMRVGVQSNISRATQMECGALFLRMRMEAKATIISVDSRVSFWLAFGITPDEQLALEEYYDRLDLSFAPVVAIDNLLSVPTCPF